MENNLNDKSFTKLWLYWLVGFWLMWGCVIKGDFGQQTKFSNFTSGIIPLSDISESATKQVAAYKMVEE